MFDFDHPVKSMRYEVREYWNATASRATCSSTPEPYEEGYGRQLPWDFEYEHMTGTR